MADNKNKKVILSGGVTPELAEFVENHRWENRLSKSEVIAKAIRTWAESEGFVQTESETVTETEDAPAEKPAARTRKA